MWRLTPIALAVVATFLAGCAGTRMGQLGVLPSGDALVTVVVSQARDIVERECSTLSAGRVYGCQSSRPVTLPDGRRARVVRIVRYTDRLPSTLAFDIEVHEVCHAVAALQGIDDPCHAGNGGLIQAYRQR